MPYLRYLYVLVLSGVQQTLCCVFLHVLYPMLLFFLDCSFLIAYSVFFNVYLFCVRKFLNPGHY
jgi:hypothetical protein